MVPDLRRLPRVPFNRQVRIAPLNGNGPTRKCFAGNLSAGGMFVEDSALWGVGTCVDVKLETNGEPIPLGEAEIVWERNLHEPYLSPSGFGLRFTSLSETSKALVDMFLKHGGTMSRPPVLGPEHPTPVVANPYWARGKDTDNNG